MPEIIFKPRCNVDDDFYFAFSRVRLFSRGGHVVAYGISQHWPYGVGDVLKLIENVTQCGQV